MNIVDPDMESSIRECQEEPNELNSVECRACLQKFDNVIGLYNLFEDWPIPWPGMGCTIADDLSKMANIQITQQNDLPTLICVECCSSLQRACMFVELVKSNDLLLRQRNPGAFDASHIDWPKPIQIESLGTYQNIPETEIKQEVVSDDEIEVNALQSVNCTTEDFVDIKVEPEELIQPVHCEYVNGLYSDNVAAITPTVNGGHYEHVDYLEEVKQEPQSEEEVKPQFEVSLECILCSKKCKSIFGLKSHVIAMHSYKGVKRKLDEASPEIKIPKHVCSTCQRSFTTSTDLMVHETCHNKQVCYSCNRNFDTFKQLIRHRKNCKAAVTEVAKPKTLGDVLRRPFPEESRIANKDGGLSHVNVNLSHVKTPQESSKSDISEQIVKSDECDEQSSEEDTVEESLRKLLGDSP